MSAEPKGSGHAGRRTSVYIDGYTHTNPIPAACRVGNVLQSSIIHGIDSSRAGAASTLEEQAELMFARMRQILEAAGGSTEDVVKVTIWMKDRAARAAINRFWLEMFPDAGNRPARQTVSAELDGEQLIQCDFVAVLDG
ncbi:RidA family protein [Rubrobacter calidifluminis]|uniref:RidA family protein n=1 Tax=Rubrobacter calidifluminis TaxID=1392640 RepID=UPI002361960A|nr:RidA family protein [Rubrobacter calidifluminis]